MRVSEQKERKKKKKKKNTYGQSRDRLLGPYLDHNKSLIWITSRPQIAVLDDSKSQIWTCARPQIADVDMRTSANRGCGRQQIAYLDDSKSQIWTTANRRCGHAHVRKSRMWTCARPQIADLDDSKSVIWITARPQNRYVDVMTTATYRATILLSSKIEAAIFNQLIDNSSAADKARLMSVSSAHAS